MRVSMAVIILLLLLHLLNVVSTLGTHRLDSGERQHVKFQFPAIGAAPTPPQDQLAPNAAHTPPPAAVATQNGTESTAAALTAPGDHASDVHERELLYLEELTRSVQHLPVNDSDISTHALLGDDEFFAEPWNSEDFIDFLSFTSQGDGASSNMIGGHEDLHVMDYRNPIVTPMPSTMQPLWDDNDNGKIPVEMTTAIQGAGMDQNYEETASTSADSTLTSKEVAVSPNSSVLIDKEEPSMLALRIRDPQKIMHVIQLFEKYSSLKNTTLLPSIRQKTTEMIRYSPPTVQNVDGNHKSNYSSPKVSYAEVGITISDFNTNLPPLKTTSKPASSSSASSVLQAFTNFIEDVGQAVGDFLSSVGNAYANNPVLTVLTLGALIFLLFHLIVNYAWFKKKPHHKGHGHEGYHKRMDIVDETFYDDALKLQRILDVIDDYERKYGEKIFF